MCLFFQLLSFPLNDCPRYKQLMNETEHTEEFLNVTTTYEVQFFFFLEYKFNNYTHNKRAVFLKPFVYFLV